MDSIKRPPSSGSSRRGSDSVLSNQNDTPVDYMANPNLYFAELAKIQKNALKVLQKEEEEEAKLLSYLPLVERSNFNKEGKVLTRWQERQKEWERVQSIVSKKLTSKVPRPLMMATTDEYRARMEEYDLIQAAIPPKDRHANSAWEMSLRGGGPIRVPVGHIFSGLECEIDPVLPKPKIVRKPKDPRNTFLTDSFLPQTEAFATKKMELQRSLKEMRPRDITFKDAGALVIKTVDLFKWARESSKEFLDGQGVPELDEASVGSRQSLLAEQRAREEEEADAQRKMPRVELVSSREVVFETTAGVECRREVVFRNVSETTIYFRFDYIHPQSLENEAIAQRAKTPARAKSTKAGSSAAQGAQDLTLAKILDAKGHEDADLRARTLAQQRDSFFCLLQSGELLPHETIAVPFAFLASAGGGYYSSTWALRFLPEPTKIQYSTLSYAGQEVLNTCTGSLRIHLVGHCMQLDEHNYKRLELHEKISHSELRTFVQDIIQDCILRVRQPVRQKDLRQREISVFQQVNRDFLSRMLTVDGLLPALFFTTDRLRSFDQVQLDAQNLYLRLSQTYLDVLEEHNALASREAEEYALPIASWHEGPSLRPSLFPEDAIEIFDQVSEVDICPLWDWDLRALSRQLEGLQPVVRHLSSLVQSIQKLRAALEKVRAREERRAKRKAAGESDDEEEEDEEEEEEEEEEKGGGSRSKPRHELEIELAALRARFQGGVNNLTVTPLNAATFDTLAGKMWLEAAVDHLENAHSRALQSSGLHEFVSRGIPIPTLPSPFTSEEGLAAWTQALNTTSPVADPPADKKAAKPAKNAPPPTAPTQQQIDFFYREMYEEVRTGILNACETLFQENSTAYRENSRARQAQHPLGHRDISQVAVARQEDVADRVVFVTVDGEAWGGDSSSSSAFPLQSIAEKQLASQLVSLLSWKPKLIVLVSESPAHVGNPASLSIRASSLQSVLTEQWARYVHRDRRARKKLKQSADIYRQVAVHASTSLAEATYQLSALLRTGRADLFSPSSASMDATEYLASHCPIFLWENLRVTGVVPSEPEFVEEESDEDEAPIYLAQEEAKSYQYNKWVAKRPFRVPVPLFPSKSIKVMQDTYCEVYAALREILALVRDCGESILWMDGDGQALFDPQRTFGHKKICELLTDQRVTTPSTRESFGWCAVLQSLREGPTALISAEEEEKRRLGEHIARLFPQCHKNGSTPRSLLILGGELRQDKFRVLDEVLELVSTPSDIVVLLLLSHLLPVLPC